MAVVERGVEWTAVEAAVRSRRRSVIIIIIVVVAELFGSSSSSEELGSLDAEWVNNMKCRTNGLTGEGSSFTPKSCLFVRGVSPDSADRMPI